MGMLSAGMVWGQKKKKEILKTLLLTFEGGKNRDTESSSKEVPHLTFDSFITTVDSLKSGPYCFSLQQLKGRGHCNAVSSPGQSPTTFSSLIIKLSK